MKKIKNLLPLMLVALMLLLSACNNTTTDTDNDPPTTEDTQNNEQTTQPPEVTDPDYNDTSNGTDPAEPDFDEWPAVIIDGTGVQGSSIRTVGDDIFPNYISLVPVAEALGAQVSINGDDVTLEGFNGSISFVIGSENFEVNGETVTLIEPAEMFDGVLYVPVLFFRDVFGANSAFFSGGEVHIATAAGDMQ